jgi:flagellar hook-length control protein FliK
MLFNPLFIQSTGLSDTSSALKPSKLNSSSYLFSDIIKIIKENTLGESSPGLPVKGVTPALTTGTAAVPQESFGHLLTLAEDNSTADSINISLNDLLKNLLITSTSEQVNNSAQTGNTANETTDSNKSSVILSKTDLENLIQKLASVFAQLNLSTDSLKLIVPANSGPVCQVNTGKNKVQNSTNQQGNNTAELVIDLSQAETQTNSSSGAVNQESLLNSLLSAITSILNNSVNDTTVKNGGKASADSSKTDPLSPDEISKAQQLAATLISLYQENKGLIIDVNSGNDSVKIEISGSNQAANPSDKNITDTNANNQVQAGISVKENQSGVNSVQSNQPNVSIKSRGTVQSNTNAVSQSNPEDVNVKVQNAQSGNSAEKAAAVISNAKDIILDYKNDKVSSTNKIIKDAVPTNGNVKVQADANVNPGNKIKVVSDQNNNTGSAEKPVNQDISGLKNNDKVIITVSSKLNNSVPVDGSGKTTVEASIKAATVTDTQSIKTGISKLNSVIDNEAPALVKQSTAADNDTAFSTNAKAESVNKNNVPASDKMEAKVSVDAEISTSDIKNRPADNSGAKVLFNTTEDSTKAKADTIISAKNSNQTNINQTVDTASEEYNAGLNFNDVSNETVKDTSGDIIQKSNQASQTNIVNRQPDNVSKDQVDQTSNFNQSTNDSLGQVLNDKQENAFNDQQQKKPADTNKTAGVKPAEQMPAEYLLNTAGSIKEKFLNQTSSTDSPAKTIKITEITKEITNLVQHNNSQSVVLQLKPESLGKIKVSIDVNNNTVNARVEVDTEAVKQIVQNNTTELRQSLNLNGMQLSSISVNVSGGEQKPYQPHPQRKKSGYQTNDKRIEDNASLASAKSLGYNTYEYLI